MYNELREKLEAVYDKGGCLMVALVVILGLGIVFGVYCLSGLIFMLLWNWLAVTLFSAPTLGYWLCVGIVFAIHWLKGLLFGKRSVKAASEE